MSQGNKSSQRYKFLLNRPLCSVDTKTPSPSSVLEGVHLDEHPVHRDLRRRGWDRSTLFLPCLAIYCQENIFGREKKEIKK